MLDEELLSAAASRFAQLLRAAPVNRISLWLRAIPSARFTLIGRRASSRSRRTRSASAASAGEKVFFSGRSTGIQSLAPVLRASRVDRVAQQLARCVADVSAASTSFHESGVE